MSSQSKQIIVLGAGMVGTSAALALQARDYDVALIDRAAPGSETSYGNAGVIQGEAREPYALPRDIATLWGIAFKQDNAVDWDVRGLLKAAPTLLPYWYNSAPKRHRRISQVYSALVARANADHAALIAASGSEALIRREGYRLIFRDAAAFDKMAGKAESWETIYGINFTIEDGKALAAAEPALRQRLAGAIHWHDAWTCSDPGGLVRAYAALFRKQGGDEIRADILGLESGSGWRVRTSVGTFDAQQVVVALGPWSPQLLEPLGYRVPMIRKRGYHMHFTPGGALPNIPMIDAEVSAVYAPMRAGLRICTGADLSIERGEAMPRQLRRAHAAASELLDLGEPVEASAWRGERPCMPDMLPVVGAAAQHTGLWFDFGHGHQGFTLGPTTGALLAGLVAGDPDPIVSRLALSRSVKDL
ncbi:FAD-binding oxidoreductase [Sphingobium amiense]|uniref:FAD-binding oxidoreductase n=1 Tax=Sphingobium amiense TaxID=135719 RepID=A0A494W0K4_9SPHN|nr:FAD-dependent oxidoreductase [Sphingobium amiense]BBD98124.1 FAD-binding oxidoreductase [Sphingobium amiense]